MPTKDLVPATTTTNVPARLQPISAAEDFVALSMSPQEFMETLQENTGSANFTYQMLDRIKFPNSEPVFEIKDVLADEVRDLAELEVILLAVQPTRTLWGGAYNPDSTEPPLCRSRDGETGIGQYGIDAQHPENPSGTCATCPMSQFTKDASGKTIKPKCALKFDLYFLTPDSMTPSIMTLPVTSGSPLKEFRMALTKSTIPLYGAVIKIKANKVKGKPYCIASFELKHKLPREEVLGLRMLSQNLRDHLIAAAREDEGDSGETVDAVEGSVASAVELPF